MKKRRCSNQLLLKDQLMICVHICIHVHILNTLNTAWKSTSLAYRYTQICVHIDMCTEIHIDICTHLHMCTHVYRDMYFMWLSVENTHAHTHTHTQQQQQRQQLTTNLFTD